MINVSLGHTYERRGGVGGGDKGGLGCGEERNDEGSSHLSWCLCSSTFILSSMCTF